MALTCNFLTTQRNWPIPFNAVNGPQAGPSSFQAGMDMYMGRPKDWTLIHVSVWSSSRAGYCWPGWIHGFVDLQAGSKHAQNDHENSLGIKQKIHLRFLKKLSMGLQLEAEIGNVWEKHYNAASSWQLQNLIAGCSSTADWEPEHQWKHVAQHTQNQ